MTHIAEDDRLRRTPLIALVHESADSREEFSEALRDVGFVLAFNSIGHARRLMQDAIVPDLLIVDLGPPADVALDFVDKVRQSNPTRSIPVIGLTARGADREFRKAAVTCILKRNIDMARLRNVAWTLVNNDQLDYAA